MLRNKKLLVLIFTLTGVLVFWEGYLWPKMYGVPYRCNVQESEKYIDSLCYYYLKKKISGSLCKPLCEDGNIIINKCLGHGVKPHVLEAEWNGVKIVLKMEKPFHYFREDMPPFNRGSRKLTIQEIVYYMNRTISKMMTPDKNRGLIYKVAKEIAQECDAGGDKLYDYREALLCWQLGSTAEYVHLSLLRENNAMVDLYGACGSMYGVQYAVSDEFFVQLSTLPEDKTWKLRSRIIIAVLDMIEALEKTPLGTFYLCDMQRPNIGLVRKENGRIVAKTIDADTVMFEKRLLEHVQSTAFHHEDCFKNSQCGYMRCTGICHKKSGTCSGRLATSNLMIMCERFVKPTDSWHTNFLRGSPDEVHEELERTLQKCSQIGNRHIDSELIYQLRKLLTDTSLVDELKTMYSF